MAEEKKPAKKKAAPKKKKSVAKPKVEMVSYALKMVIPTVEYGNIQPEIIVKAGSPDEAHDYIAPHMNKLWKEYYLVDGRRKAVSPPNPAPTPTAPKVEVTPVATDKPLKNCACQPNRPCRIHAPNPVPPTPAPQEPAPAPASSVAFVKASQAIDSCMSADALQLIIDQVYKSTKLTEEDKIALAPKLEAKHQEFKK